MTSKKTRGANTPAQSPSQKDLIVGTINSANLASLARVKFYELHSILNAICKFSEPGQASPIVVIDDGTIYGLAEVGTRLAESFAQKFDDKNCEYSEKLKVLRALKEENPQPPQCLWIPAGTGTLPNSDRDVIAWHSKDEQPIPAFYAYDEDIWMSKIDGEKFENGVISHWYDYKRPVDVKGGAA